MVWRGERFHVLILGSRRVGKSALLEQLVRSSFKEEVDVQMAKMEETVTVQCCVDQKSLLVDGKGRGRACSDSVGVALGWNRPECVARRIGLVVGGVDLQFNELARLSGRCLSQGSRLSQCVPMI